ncbi:unnamed protein product [Rhodiola kirilowii]
MGDYYDMDEIMMEEELVSVVFQKAANGVVQIDPSAETNTVEPGSKVELPFWLAQELHMRQAVSMSMPTCFDQKTRKEIQADVACVDLRNRCPYFYELGCKVAPLIGEKTIGPLLLYAFKCRYKDILIKGHNASHIAPKSSSLLTKEESNLYEAARSSMTAFKKWRIGGSRYQRATILGKKRKSFE